MRLLLTVAATIALLGTLGCGAGKAESSADSATTEAEEARTNLMLCQTEIAARYFLNRIEAAERRAKGP